MGYINVLISRNRNTCNTKYQVILQNDCVTFTVLKSDTIKTDILIGVPLWCPVGIVWYRTSIVRYYTLLFLIDVLGYFMCLGTNGFYLVSEIHSLPESQACCCSATQLSSYIECQSVIKPIILGLVYRIFARINIV